MRIKPAYYKRLCHQLSEYKIHKIAIQDAEQKLIELNKDVETGVGGTDYAKDYVISSKTSTLTEDIAIARIEVEAYYENIIRSRKEKYDLLTKALDILDSDERKIIIAIHCDHQNWTQVQHMANWSRRTCIRRRNEGMSKLALYIYGEQAREVQLN